MWPIATFWKPRRVQDTAWITQTSDPVGVIKWPSANEIISGRLTKKQRRVDDPNKRVYLEKADGTNSWKEIWVSFMRHFCKDKQTLNRRLALEKWNRKQARDPTSAMAMPEAPSTRKADQPKPSFGRFMAVVYRQFNVRLKKPKKEDCTTCIALKDYTTQARSKGYTQLAKNGEAVTKQHLNMAAQQRQMMEIMKAETMEFYKFWPEFSELYKQQIMPQRPSDKPSED